MQKTRMQEKYEKEIVPALKSELGIQNVNALPRFVKVTLNVGLKNGIKDSKFVDVVEKTLIRISGQKPVRTKARKSIAGFKIREGNIVGMAVTLRGKQMQDFIDRLINLTLPRMRDFRGLPEKSVDAHGNLTVGFREYLAFPEIRPEDADVSHGLEVTVVTSAGDRERGMALLKAAGFPFRSKTTKK